MSDEESGSGAPIHRHEHEADAQWSGGDPGLIEAVTRHVETHIGTPANVWHQPVSPWVHVDIHVVEPTPERPYFTLVSSGMAEKPMTVPEGAEDLRHAELVMALPGDWPITEARGRWPLELMQDLAQLPHQYDAWFWADHTIPNGDPPEPYAPGTELCGVLLAPPLGVPDDFRVLRHGDREIHLLGVVALHADEMQLKLEDGVEALYPLLDEHDVSELLETGRPSVAGPRRRRRFGFRRR